MIRRIRTKCSFLPGSTVRIVLGLRNLFRSFLVRVVFFGRALFGFLVSFFAGRGIMYAVYFFGDFDMEVRSLVFGYIFDKFKLEVLESTLLSDFVEDSMDRVEMLFELEEMFGVSLSEDDVLGLEKVGDICVVVEGMLGG